MREGEEAFRPRMRAAILTTACVIAALVVWSNLREAARSEVAISSQLAPATPTAPDLADVATAPVPPASSAPDAVAAVRAEATYLPAAGERAREHVVAADETLADIALRYYGDAARADLLYAANRDRIRDPQRLHAGQRLIIP
jgi:nucleoid-associated protein YgaU